MVGSNRVRRPSSRPTSTPEDVAWRLTVVPNPGRGIFIYVIANEQGRIKLGVSGNPRARLAACQSLSTAMLRLAFIFQTTGNSYKIEDAARHLLRRCRRLNGWFVATPEIGSIAIRAAAGQLGLAIEQVDLSDVGDTEVSAQNIVCSARLPLAGETECRDISLKRGHPNKIKSLALHLLAYACCALISAGPLYALFKITEVMSP